MPHSDWNFPSFSSLVLFNIPTVLGISYNLENYKIPAARTGERGIYVWKMLFHSLGLVLVSFASLSIGQTACENYGVSFDSSCSCPPGLGGSTCSSPACGGNIFQGTQRNLISGSTATSFGNLTSSGCSCQDGWTGTGCNVCQGATSCQSAFAAANGTSSSLSSSSGLGGLDGSEGLNSTLTCNTQPQVWAAGEMSCQVIVRARAFFILVANLMSGFSLRTQPFKHFTPSTLP